MKGGRCLKSAQAGSRVCHIHRNQGTCPHQQENHSDRAARSSRIPSTARNQNRATPVATVPDQRQPARNQRSATPASSVPDERQSAHRDRYTEQCRRVRANGQRCGRQTTAINSDFCSEHQRHPSSSRRRNRSVSFSSPPRSHQSRSPARSARILASFAVEDLQAEVLRRIPVSMRSATASVVDDFESLSGEAEDEDGEEFFYD